ncbi:MAG: di-trans,poly-cis-decaprenylcistransferase [Rhodospirillales bacterium]|nr:di-trans,poly-cis-decaprenylcistransferase [Rhodospirillales bacterium]
MDGNGRWAAARGLQRTQGHRRGAESVKTAAECAVRLGVRYLTLFGFSSENWGRPDREISDLMGLLRYYLRSELGFLQEHGIRLQVIGDRGKLAPDIVKAIEKVEQETAGNGRLVLTMALSYGARAEICDAARRLAEEAAAGRLDPARIDEKLFARYLYTWDVPDPDLVIRTSGEQRISNFLLWQVAYSELMFIETYWPDFSRQDFEQAITEFSRRERRYGSVSA